MTRTWDKWWLDLIRDKPKQFLIKQEEFANVPLGKKLDFLVGIQADDVVDKIVCDLGCGLASAHQKIAIHTKQYIGIDTSDVVITLARILSPHNTVFFNIENNREDIKRNLAGKIDTVMANNLFIHLNHKEIEETMDFAAAVLKPWGTFVANFFRNAQDFSDPLLIGSQDHSNFDLSVVPYEPCEIEDILREKFIDITVKAVTIGIRNHPRWFVRCQKRYVDINRT